MLKLEEFFSNAKLITERYESTSKVLTNEIAQKNVALAIEDALATAISSTDTKKILDSINIENIPSFGFDENYKKEMVEDICQMIQTEQCTVSEFIDSKLSKIELISDTLVGGVEEIYDGLPNSQYEYKKEIEEIRQQTLLMIETIQSFAISQDNLPRDLSKFIKIEDEITKKLNVNLIESSNQGIEKALKACLGGYAVLGSLDVPMEDVKIAETFVMIRTLMAPDGVLTSEQVANVDKVFSEIKDDYPSQWEKLGNINESFFKENIEDKHFESETSKVRETSDLDK